MAFIQFMFDPKQGSDNSIQDIVHRESGKIATHVEFLGIEGAIL